MKKMICAALMLCLSLTACGAEAGEVPTQAVTEAAAEASTEAVTQAAAEETVEITLDNWQDYFELRPAADAVIDGDTESWSLGYGVFLKEEYTYVSGHVDFELQYDLELREFQGNAQDLTWTLGDLLEPDHELLPGARTFGLEDVRELPGFSGTMAGVCLPGTVLLRADGSLAAEVPVNGEILHAEGQLVLSR